MSNMRFMYDITIHFLVLHRFNCRRLVEVIRCILLFSDHPYSSNMFDDDDDDNVRFLNFDF